MKWKHVNLLTERDFAVGQILAEDIIDPITSLAYCNSGIELTTVLIDWLTKRNVNVVRVEITQEPVIPEERLSIDPELLHAIVTKRDANIVEVKHQFEGISQGAEVKVDRLYDVVADVMQPLKSRGDVLKYIRYFEKSDEITYGHGLNVAMLCNLFGTWLKMSEDEITLLTAAGALHDIGKIKTPIEILAKPGALTAEELIVMRRHVDEGYDILRRQPLSESVKLAALLHHERINGTGYPLGCTRTNIDKYARIIAICDIYDAMISRRHYKDDISPFYTIRVFERQMYSELDPLFLLIFLKNIAHSFLHCRVQLTDGRYGEVVYIHNQDLSRPIVMCGETFVDLHEDKNLDISKVF